MTDIMLLISMKYLWHHDLMSATTLAQTTLRLDEALYREAKAAAALAGMTITRFIEDALRLKLRQPVTGVVTADLPSYASPAGFPFTPEEITALAREGDEEYDLGKLMGDRG